MNENNEKTQEVRTSYMYRTKHPGEGIHQGGRVWWGGTLQNIWLGYVGGMAGNENLT